jgi:pyruvate/2-oxoglutarate dehydrogenase complex dihydrolipoamide dehydrogenase (E3) component
MPHDDPELTAVVADRLRSEGINIFEGARAVRVAGEPGAVEVHWQAVEGATGVGDPSSSNGSSNGSSKSASNIVSGSHILVAAGRRANVDGLGLDAAGVNHTPRGIDVDRKLRTANRRIYAIGDVIGQHQFTHAAGYHGGIVIRNLLFRMGAKIDVRAMPWVTYTDPELAQVGMTEATARDAGHQVRILTAPFADNDRARAERATAGFAKIVTDRRGRILGASIVGHHAGELVLPWGLAISRGLKIGAMANLVAPYPTFSEISKRAAGSYYTDSLFSDRTRRIVRTLLKLG